MKLVTYQYEGNERVGALTPDGAAIRPLPYPDMNTLIESASFADLLSAASAAESSGASVPAAEAVLLAPIPRPRQDIICLGMHYRDPRTAAATAARADAQDPPGPPGGPLPHHRPRARLPACPAHLLPGQRRAAAGFHHGPPHHLHCGHH